MLLLLFEILSFTVNRIFDSLLCLAWSVVDQNITLPAKSSFLQWLSKKGKFYSGASFCVKILCFLFQMHDEQLVLEIRALWKVSFVAPAVSWYVFRVPLVLINKGLKQILKNKQCTNVFFWKPHFIWIFGCLRQNKEFFR